MPNLHGLFATMGGWFGASTNSVILGTGIASLVLVCVVAWLSASEMHTTFDLKFSLAVITAVLVSYHAFEYDLTLLLLPIVLIVGFVTADSDSSADMRAWLLVPILLLFFSPLHFALAIFGRQTSLIAVVLLVLACAIGQILRRQAVIGES